MFTNKKKSLKFGLIIAVSILTGILLQQYVFSSIFQQGKETIHEKSIEQEKQTIWTCSMHPQIRLPKPGKCPICFMDLIPLNTDDSNDSDVQISISSNTFKRLEIDTTPVLRKFVDSELLMLGKVDYDETRLSYISAWVPGRLEELFINYTGIPVKKGDKMATIYSPDLINAQEEFIQSLTANDTIQNGSSDTAKKNAISTIAASREKLSLLGLSAEQINDIEKTRSSEKIITINAPTQGIVIEKNAKEGMYVQTGTKIYTIADLSYIWVRLDAYESDLALIKYGSTVEFSTEAYPGKTFEGRVDFIDPVVDAKSQTIKVRVSVPNKNLELKPGMFVKAIVNSQLDSKGKVLEKVETEKWVCPMHPEIVKDQPGDCDICHMTLVATKSANYDSKTTPPLVIPVTAAMRTGKRTIVYVEVPQIEKPTYEGREIVLGSRAGIFYIVKSGLEEGERVVTRGNFKLDAEMQIRAKPSMMSENTKVMPNMQNEQHEKIGNKAESSEQMNAIPEEFSSQLNKVLLSYFAIQKAMVEDNSKNVNKATEIAIANLKAVDMTILDHKTHMVWMKNADALTMTLQMLSKQSTLIKQRELLPRLTDEMLKIVQQFPVGKANIYKASCPMAFDNKGASWLQENDQVLNPYFGATMLHCGSIDEVIQESNNGDNE